MKRHHSAHVNPFAEQTAQSDVRWNRSSPHLSHLAHNESVYQPMKYEQPDPVEAPMQHTEQDGMFLSSSDEGASFAVFL